MVASVGLASGPAYASCLIRKTQASPKYEPSAVYLSNRGIVCKRCGRLFYGNTLSTTSVSDEIPYTPGLFLHGTHLSEKEQLEGFVYWGLIVEMYKYSKFNIHFAQSLKKSFKE